VKRVALVTCATLPELDRDDRQLLEPLRALGIEATPAVWDDPMVDWAAFDLVVIRNPWDYTSRRDEFVRWARSVPRLANPGDVVEWNTDKQYLAELAAGGVPIVPTTWLSPGEVANLPGGGRHVVKPSVGAGSVGAAAFSMDDARDAARAAKHTARLLEAGLTVMVQPYLERIEQRGETGVIFVGGKFSHGIAKGAMLVGDRGTEAEGLYKQETITARQPTDAEMEVARLALDSVPGGPHRLLYARIDLVPAVDGAPLLMELELAEPSLFMHTAPGSVDRFADAIAAFA
jgi:hypothetical protein